MESGTKMNLNFIFIDYPHSTGIFHPVQYRDLARAKGITRTEHIYSLTIITGLITRTAIISLLHSFNAICAFTISKQKASPVQGYSTIHIIYTVLLYLLRAFFVTFAISMLKASVIIWIQPEQKTSHPVLGHIIVFALFLVTFVISNRKASLVQGSSQSKRHHLYRDIIYSLRTLSRDIRNLKSKGITHTGSHNIARAKGITRTGTQYK